MVAASTDAEPQTGSGIAAPAADVTDLLHIAVLDGWQTDTGSHMAALRITLEDGWKTYWRMPGDSGIPASCAALTFSA